MRAAIANSGFDFPLKRITVNLAPANLRKAGPGFDLAIASAILVASEQLPPDTLDACAVAGELALDGALRPAPGALPMAEEAARLGLTRLAIAEQSGPEAALAAQLARNGSAPLRVTPMRRLDQLSLIRSPGRARRARAAAGRRAGRGRAAASGPRRAPRPAAAPPRA